VLVVGSVNMDFVAYAERLPARGETVGGASFAASPGGKGANQAVAAARLGARTALLGCVGDDTLGDALRAALQADGVDCGALKTVHGASGVAIIVVERSGANTIVVAPGANGQLSPADIAAHDALFAQARVVVLQLEVPLEATLAAAQAARRHGATVVLNPAPAQALPAELLRCVDLLVPNESEAALLAGLPVADAASAAAAADVLRHLGARGVLVTLGASGLLASTDAGDRHHAAPVVQAVDTTAAGDTFVGGLSCGLAEGLALPEAIALGQAAAAISVTRAGAQPSIPWRREIGAAG